jgi:phosphoribosylformimino-5-aminoimidazole carboxamide ribotide isomerase
MKPFIVFPAIDLRNGCVVRLKEGDPNRQTSYANDPVAVARRWLDAGARWLHVVNLDAAFGEDDYANWKAIKGIVKASREASVQVQLGGGLRSVQAVQKAFKIGICRVILGTMAVEHPEKLDQLLNQWKPDRVGVSIDARGGMVTMHGWQKTSAISALDLAQGLAGRGVQWLVFTDIARDGMQTGINLAATHQIAKKTSLEVIASGGVSGWEDIHSARKANLSGIIVGKALYEGIFDPPMELFKEPTLC